MAYAIFPASVCVDGGITDYHFDTPLSYVDGIVLYLHFSPRLVPVRPYDALASPDSGYQSGNAAWEKRKGWSKSLAACWSSNHGLTPSHWHEPCCTLMCQTGLTTRQEALNLQGRGL